MNKRWTGYAAMALTASLAFGTVGTTYGATLTLAGFGSDQEVKETEVEVVTQPETQAATEAPQTEAPQTEAPQTEAPQTEVQTEEPQIDKSMVNTTAFAKSDEPVSVYVSGDTEGEVVGTLNKNDAVEILDVDENGWAKIKSGNVEGYAALYKLATGAEAEAVADSAAYNYAKIGAEYLNIRSDASEEGEVLDTVGQDADLEIVEDCGDWLKVATSDGMYGYVSADYVTKETAYSTGETVQEQSEREEQEYTEYVEQQEAEYAAYVAQQSQTEAAAAETPVTEAAWVDTTSVDTTSYDTTSYDTTTTDTSTTAAVSSTDVDALYNAYLAAHEASLSATDEADAQAKAQASIDAYNAYLAALGSSETVPSVTSTTTDTTTDTTTTDTTTDTAAVDTTQTEAPQTEAPQTEAPQTEAQTEAAVASSGSGAGASVASYACQFVGNPYVYGGTSLTNGCDCSGFTMSVYANFGVSLPHNAAAQSGCGTSVTPSEGSLQAGDLIFYGDGGIGHVAIYCGNGTVVHASNEETGIKYSSYNYRTPVAAVRLV